MSSDVGCPLEMATNGNLDVQILDVLGQSRALFVQPHLDDVAFACGGVVARAADAGDHPIVIGVFTGPPTQTLGENIRELHAKWGFGDDAWLSRRGEDQRGCEVMAAVPLWLPYQDAPYRGYATFASIFEPISEDDPLIQRIADDLLAHWRQTPNATVHLPLGIGAHVDHQLCHATGAILEAAGVTVRYYEDFPYGALPGLVIARLAALRDPFAAELVDVTNWIDRRIAAANAYASQVGALFTATSLVSGPTDQAIKRHAGALAGGLPGYIERGPHFAECLYRRSHG
jgi:LmbE family N-acetylglucosaminyl deacetylase